MSEVTLTIFGSPKEDSALWKHHRQQWMIRAVQAIADARDIDEESAKNVLCESGGMDSYDEFAIVQRHMENLKTIINSFSVIPDAKGESTVKIDYRRDLDLPSVE